MILLPTVTEVIHHFSLRSTTKYLSSTHPCEQQCHCLFSISHLLPWTHHYKRIPGQWGKDNQMHHSSVGSQRNFVLGLLKPLGGPCLDKNLVYLEGRKDGLIRFSLTFPELVVKTKMAI